MLENLKGIFFDLDDTLINFSGVTKKAWEWTAEKLIAEYPEIEYSATELGEIIYDVNQVFWSNDENRKKANINPESMRKEMLNLALVKIGLNEEKYIDYLTDAYPTLKNEAVYLFPDVHETLIELKNKGYKLALITNGNGIRQRDKIARFKLADYFDAILIEGEQAFGKPDKRVYQKALDICQITAAEACMVGDNYLWEVEAPIDYGMKGVWFKTDYNNELPKTAKIEPDLVIENISELLEW